MERIPDGSVDFILALLGQSVGEDEISVWQKFVPSIIGSRLGFLSSDNSVAIIVACNQYC